MTNEYGLPEGYEVREMTVEQAEAEDRAEKQASIGEEHFLMKSTGTEVHYTEEKDLHYLADWDRWKELKAKMRPGDKLVKYRSDHSSWMALAGREGWALVRDGKPIIGILTCLS